MKKPDFWPNFLGVVPYIIAEVGSNWETIEDCVASIKLAAACGANAVKFQYFTYDDLYGPRPSLPRDTLEELHGRIPTPELPREWIPTLANACKSNAVDFLCTVFNPEKVKDVDPYVRMHKVASSECSYVALLEALKATGKPVILSTGGHMLPEIARSLDVLGRTEVCLMYCVAAYPAVNVNLFKIDALRNAYPLCGVGFSDHTTDVHYYPRAAVKNHGALIIEKHFTIFKEPGLPDYEHAMKWRAEYREATVIDGRIFPAGYYPTEVHQLKLMCDYVRGPGFIPPSEDCRDDERDMRDYHRRRRTEGGFYRRMVRLCDKNF